MKTFYQYFSKKPQFLLLAIFLFSLLLKIIGLLSNKSLHLDEAVVWNVANRNAIDILAGNFYEFKYHGPLFYLLIHFWQKISISEIWLRIPSVLFNIFTLLALYLLTKKILGQKSSLLASFLFATSAYHNYWSVQARVYETVTFFSVLYIFTFIVASEKNLKKLWLLTAVIASIGISIDYSFIWIYLSVNLYFIISLLIKKRAKTQLKLWLISNAIVIGVFLYYFVKVSHLILSSSEVLKHTSKANIYSLVRLLITFLNIHYLNFHGKFTPWQDNIYITFSLVPLILVLKQTFTFKKEKTLLFSIITFFPVIASFLISQVYPIFIHYNLIIVSVGIILLLSTIRREFLIFLVCIFWLLINLFSFYEFIHPPSQEDWKSILPILKQYTVKAKLVIFPFYFQTPFLYYDKLHKLNMKDSYIPAWSNSNVEETIRKYVKLGKPYCLLVRVFDSNYKFFKNEYLNTYYKNYSAKTSGIEVYCKGEFSKI